MSERPVVPVCVSGWLPARRAPDRICHLEGTGEGGLLCRSACLCLSRRDEASLGVVEGPWQRRLVMLLVSRDGS